MAGIRADLTLDYSEALSQADELGASLEQKLAGVELKVDTGQAEADIDNLSTKAQSLDPTVTIEADTTDAQANLDALDDSITSAGASADTTSGSLGGLTGAADDLGSGVSAASDIVSGASDDLGDFAQNAVSAVDGLASGAQGIGDALSSVAGGASEIATEGGGAVQAIGAIGGGIGSAIPLITTITGALAIGAGALGLFGDSAAEADPKVTDFADSVREANGAVIDGTVEAANELLRSRNQLDDFAESGIRTADALRAVASSTKSARSDLSDLVDVSTRLAAAQQNVKTSAPDSAAYDSAVASVRHYKDAQQELIDKLRETDPALANILAKLAASGQLNPGIITTLLDLAGAYKGAATDASNLADIAETGASRIATAVSAARDALDGYKSGTNDATTATNALDDAVSILQDDLDLLLGNFLSAEEATGQLQQKINGINFDLATGKTPLDAYTSSATDAGLALLGMGDNAENAALAVLRQTQNATEALVPLQNYRNELQTIRDKLSAAGLDTTFIDGLIAQVDGAIAKMQEKQPAAEAAGKGVGDAASRGWQQGLVPFASHGAKAGQDGADGINSKKGAAEGAGRGNATGAASGWQAGLVPFASHGAAAGQSGADGVRSAERAAHDAGFAVGSGATVAAQSALGSWFGIGQSAASGMEAGILSVAGSIAGAAASVGRSAINALKAELNISSPSKVAELEVGVPIGEGIAIGIEITVDRVTRAAVESVDRATDAATDAIAQWTADQMAIIEQVALEAQGLWATDQGKADWINSLWLPDDLQQAAIDKLAAQTTIIPAAAAAAARSALDLIGAGGDKQTIVDQLDRMVFDAAAQQDTVAAELLKSIDVNFRNSAELASSNTEGIAFLKSIDAQLRAQQAATEPPKPVHIQIQIDAQGNATATTTGGALDVQSAVAVVNSL